MAFRSGGWRQQVQLTRKTHSRMSPGTIFSLQNNCVSLSRQRRLLHEKARVVHESRVSIIPARVQFNNQLDLPPVVDTRHGKKNPTYSDATRRCISVADSHATPPT